jgi:hypothetical protein
MSARPLWALLIAIAAPLAARADDGLAAATPGLAPDSFAVQALGAPDLQVTRPGSLKAASAAMGAFVRGGKLAPGAAVEVTPWDLYFNGVTYQQYVSNPWMRRFVNLALSLATVGGGDTDPVRSSLAARMVLWDDADWRLNDAAIGCARRVLGEPQQPGDAPPDKTVVVQPELTGEQQTALRRCRLDHTAWNASQAAFGAALTLATPGGVLQDTRPDGAAGWFSIAVPMGHSFQLLSSARYTFHKATPTALDVPGLPATHVGGVGARLTFYQGRFVAMLDTGVGAQRQGGDWSGRGLLGLTLQVLLWGQTWGELGGSQDFVLKPGADQRLTVTTNLKWNHDIASGLH